ncbi:hypothetical protein AVEN_203493-1 [Araneus ventricosus]|uniref:Uncharacterized protein n=1 Tax=Araneus ventricosus TaxID=182803 RepID=A0A4Y2BGF4_ARAVE|nr:hypothetical protein AVEN_203493-1 [Araneus ventricosus]
MRRVIHGGSNVLYHRSFITPTVALRSPYFSSPTRRISNFLASSRGHSLGRFFDMPLPSHRGPKLESAHEVLDFEFVGIPALPFRYANFHLFLKLTIAFSFPCSKNSILEEMRMACFILTSFRSLNRSWWGTSLQ